MKTIKLSIILLIFSVLFMFGCKTKQTVTTKYVKVDSIVYSERITTEYDTIVTPPDSATIKAYFECDSLGNVLIKELNEEKGRMKVRTIFKNNTIEVLVNVDSAEIIRRAEEQFLKNYKAIESSKDTSVSKKRTYAWYIIFLAGACFGALVLFLINRIALK